MSLSIFWFRRDLRLFDNAGLYHALKENNSVLPIFIFDKEILDELPPKDARVEFILNQLESIDIKLKNIGSSLLVFNRISPKDAFIELIEKYNIHSVYTNHDYEPYAVSRDESIKRILDEKGITFKTFKDQVIFEKGEILKDDGKPYTVYTPYSKKYKSKISSKHFEQFNIDLDKSKFHQEIYELPSLNDIGFKRSNIKFPSNEIPSKIISNYHNTRDIPSVIGTSRLSLHLRFGTISIRELAKYSIKKNEKYFNELIWREFYMMILWHFPHVVHSSFKSQYDSIKWRNDKDEFERWKNGTTGYPIVDAGIRELNNTGYMHNRVRMIVASFLTKHLLIDWRWGEAYFAEKLLDFELSSNNGGWQWAAGSGCDAASYFRVFNPYLQTEKFDPELKYIKKWVPEFQDFTKYPQPIVEHKYARERCLSVYKEALKK